MEVIKQPKDNPVSERMSITAASRLLFEQGYYRTISDARQALLSHIPVMTHSSVFTLAE